MRSKQTNFQRMVEPPPASNVSMKAKYLSKMPLYSSYSMFSNESNESLNVTEDKTADTTLASPAMESPSSVKLNFRYSILFFCEISSIQNFQDTWNFNYNIFQCVTLSIFYINFQYEEKSKYGQYFIVFQGIFHRISDT